MQANELLNTYHVDLNTWDEMYQNASVREQYRGVVEFMQELSIDELNRKEEMARKLFMSQGITFTVYSSGEGIEKIFPFDIIPPYLRKYDPNAPVVLNLPANSASGVVLY